MVGAFTYKNGKFFQRIPSKQKTRKWYRTAIRRSYLSYVGKHLKLYMHPPSIPAKFQTIHFDNSQDKGFNSTCKRFNTKLVYIHTIFFVDEILGGSSRTRLLF